jgi:uncharacterized protein YgbK (DUF1537 family)
MVTVASTALREVRESVRAQGIKIAVIDDDPTGTQVVRDVPMVAGWDDDELAWAIERADPLFAVLTNSRALPEAEAQAINATIGRRLARLGDRLGFGIRAISRSDSTLRGHFPAEPEALAAGLGDRGQAIDAIVVCPAFPLAGRVTVDDVHLVRSGDALVPVGTTEYASDPVFPYHASNLVEWVRERAGGEALVTTISIDDLRDGGPDRVVERLFGARGVARYVVANAADDADLDVLALGVDRAERHGMRFVCRTGPSFLAARAGLAAPPALPVDTRPAQGPGLIVVGSHTALTTAQLASAQVRHELAIVTLDVDGVLAEDAEAAATIARASAGLRAALEGGDAALVTTRASAHAGRTDHGRQTSRAIADAVVDVVGPIVADTAIGWLLAKGGITSHDIAFRALRTRRAMVLGQVFPGQVSVWELGAGSVRPGLRYVVFPGNVGDEQTLARTLDWLKGAR